MEHWPDRSRERSDCSRDCRRTDRRCLDRRCFGQSPCLRASTAAGLLLPNACCRGRTRLSDRARKPLGRILLQNTGIPHLRLIKVHHYSDYELSFPFGISFLTGDMPRPWRSFCPRELQTCGYLTLATWLSI